MTKAQFVRWANRREKAADHLRKALALIEDMNKISRCSAADVAFCHVEEAVDDLADALEATATEEP